MLVRYQLAIQFAEANPNLSFESPRGGVQGGGITILRMLNGTGITFSAIRRRVHVKCQTSGVDEWIEADDSHHFQALMEHNQHVIEAQSHPGNPAILHAIEQEPHIPTPEEIQMQQVHNTWAAEFNAFREAQNAVRDAWMEAHPEPPVPNEDVPF